MTSWNDASEGLTIPELFRAQVIAAPDAVAVVSPSGRLTYAQLDVAASVVAQRLHGLGAGPGHVVGVCAAAQEEMVVAILGVLLSGAAYVPLDPAYPPDRLSFMLTDSGAAVVVVGSGVTLPGATPVSMDGIFDGDQAVGAQARERRAGDGTSDDSQAGESQAGQGPAGDHIWESVASPQDLAYVIYTSGSTGRPKGVEVTHANLVGVLGELRQYFGSEVLLLASLTFDASWRALGILLTGGCLHVLDSRKDLAAASRYLRDNGVGSVSCTPSQLAMLLGGRPAPANLRIMAGGEAFPADLWQSLASRPDVAAFNLYGPTECTVDATVARVSGDRPVIGRPVRNAYVYVLDTDLALAPAGVSGELYIGGVGVARGYRGRPGLTAERFVPDPFGAPGERLYRTGDQVRFTDNGDLEFLGRLDDQVKIRGYRVEPGEIEAILRQDEAVDQAVVIAREYGTGDTRLLAYVTPARPVHQEPATAGSSSLSSMGVRLRDDLALVLPDYLVPATVMVLDHMPLAPGGKLDRAALPSPDGIRPRLAARFEPPVTPVQEIIAGIWSGLLGVAPIGITDDFFDLGGHSMLAIQVISRINAAFSVDLTLRAIFDIPTITALAHQVEESTGVTGSQWAAPLEPVSRTDRLPLSFAQQRLWFLDQLNPGNPFYNIPDAVRLRGELNVKALGRALSEVVARHEVLRTTLHEQDGVAWQAVGPPLEVTLPVLDLSTEPDPLGTARQLATEEARIPFDLSAGPLLRARLLRLANDDHVLCVTMHHVVADAWSRSVLVRELGSLYGAFAEGQEPSLPALPLQYADFAVWQRRWLGDGELVKQLGYWRERLSGAPPVLQLPADRPRPVVNSYRGASWLFDVPGDTGRGLRALGQEHGATLFMVLLAAFQAVLSRFAATRDVVVGVPMAGRVRAELESLIGFFVNTLVMRTDCTGDPRFVELLARVRETALGAYAHQDLPFEHLVEELSPTREVGRNPLVQVMFQLNNAPQPALDLSGLRLEPFTAIDEVTRFDLSMYLLETGDGLSGQVVYHSDLFDEKTAVRLAEAFQQVLSAVAADPSLRCSALPVLGQPERQRLLTDWGHTPDEVPSGLTVPELFRAQVNAAPDAVAVVSPSRRLTYAQLDAAASTVAQRLRGLGVGPGHVVGVCAAAQIEMVAGILGVMLAGAAYVPLDPAHPMDRLSFMLTGSGAAVVVTGTGVKLPGVTPVSMEGIFDGDQAGESQIGQGEAGQREASQGQASKSLSQSVASAQDLAYVIYTSGSTGRPKGVEVTHASMANLAEALDAKLNEPGQGGAFASGTKTLLTSSFVFDASIKQFLLMLSGVTLHVLDDDLRRDPAAVVRYLRSERIDSFNCTPSMLRAIIGAGAFDQDYAPRGSLIGGEAIDQELWLLLAELSEKYGHEAVNLYGPTECTVDATMARVSGDRPVIGRPVRNAYVYVLDAVGALTPAGVAGELYIGGIGVARGYRGRPDLTAQRFIPDPFGTPGQRLYRTGDRVRYTDTGDLEFLGRLDDQVKIRGYRVEPGEIEAILRQDHAVDQAIVIAREYGTGDTRLLAYVTPADLVQQQPAQTGPAQQEPATADQVRWEAMGVRLRDDLAKSLPDYLVPATVLVLDHMPLAPGGKLDRAALPSPDGIRPRLGARFQPPTTPVQEIIAGIWTSLLGVAPIGITDDFFDLGGHSMLAIQVISHINTALGVELTLRTIFDTPTITALADQAEALLPAPEDAI